MKPARLRLASAMGIVLVSALDCALIRASRLVIGGTPGDFRLQLIVLSVLPMANVLAISLFLLARRSSPSSRFLHGFATSAAITTALFLAGATFLDRDLIQPPMDRLVVWVATPLFGNPYALDTTKILIFCAIFALIFALPQLLLALVVGFLARNFRKASPSLPGPSASSD
jgi:hypothetical protein